MAPTLKDDIYTILDSIRTDGYVMLTAKLGLLYMSIVVL